MHVAGFTNTGKTRIQNEDAIFFTGEPIGPLPNLFIVADGMGGHNAGDVASEEAVNSIADYIRELKGAEFVQLENYLDLLVSAVQGANKKVCEMSEANPEMEGMGTTLTVCTITEEKLIVAHVGDSRAYAISEAGITQVTEDHTYVEEMVQAGQITADEAGSHPSKHVITRALGISGSFEVDGIIVPLNDTTSVLLCSDGLTNMVDDCVIKEIVDGLGFVEHRAQFLIEEANMRGGHDNISAILIDINR